MRVWVFYYFDFERNHDVIKSNKPCFFSNKKNYTLMETKRNQK